MKSFSGLVLLVFFSCQHRQDNMISTHSNADTVHTSKELNFQTDTILLEEFFSDSITVGRKSYNKIELSNYSSADRNYVIIKFFSKQKNKWNLRNEFHFEKDGIADCDTKLSDFNKDGLNDMTYISTIAARGANEIRRLFMYHETEDKLIYIKNSESYPNMLYNKELNCIDAFLVYGGCSTVFLKLSGDSLKQFASVALVHGLTITEYGTHGEERIIRQDTAFEGGYIRYINYNPLKEYQEE